MLGQERIDIGRQHVATMKKMVAIIAVYRRANTSEAIPDHQIYPYLLRKLAIARSNLVWATVIRYIPMAKGFVHLVAIVDCFSHKVLARRVSGWRPTSASRRWKKRSPNMACLRFSTPTKAASLPAWPSSAPCCTRKSRSAWMVRAHGAIRSLTNTFSVR